MHKNTGFTLIEVLITMVVLAVGLLGLAGLQITSLKNNQSAYHRSQANQLAYDIIDRMRANNFTDSASGDQSTVTYITGTATAHSDCLTLAGCSPTEMAENDLFQWQDALNKILPNGQGSISMAGGLYTITILWDDNRNGSIDANDPNFSVGFQL